MTPKHLIKRDANFAIQYWVCIIFLVSSCTLPGLSSQETDASQQALENTLVAMSLQVTTIAKQATKDAQNIQSQATQFAQQQALLLTRQATLSVQTTPTAFDKETSTLATIQPTSLVSAITSSSSGPNLQTKMQAAKILLFEDISGSKTRLPRYIKEVLDKAGYSYTDVGSGQGWLRDQLESETNWDLIIISSEISGRISGDFFDKLAALASKGAALILEFGDLDEIFDGKSKNLLNECGIEYEMDLPGSASGPL